jgi:hypothetical protein
MLITCLTFPSSPIGATKSFLPFWIFLLFNKSYKLSGIEPRPLFLSRGTNWMGFKKPLWF